VAVFMIDLTKLTNDVAFSNYFKTFQVLKRLNLILMCWNNEDYCKKTKKKSIFFVLPFTDNPIKLKLMTLCFIMGKKNSITKNREPP